MTNRDRGQPLVSVLVPIYNHEAYIVECLNSIVNQDYKNIEILLLDDGSTDNSYEVASSWIKRNPDVNASINKQINSGVCRTLNTLIRQSSGEFVTLCASDDLMVESGIKLRVEVLLRQPDKFAVVGDAHLIDDLSGIIATSAMAHLYQVNFQRLVENPNRELIYRWSVVGPTLLIRRSAYDLLGYYNESLKVEDRDFFLRLFSIRGLVFIPDPVAGYRIHESNASRKSIESKLIIYRDVAQSNLAHSDKFKSAARLFLLSHRVDLFLLNKFGGRFAYYILNSYRYFRRVLFLLF